MSASSVRSHFRKFNFVLTNVTALFTALFILSVSNVAHDDGSDFPKNSNFVFEGGSIFVVGKVSEHTGGFIQSSYDNWNDRGNDTYGDHGAGRNASDNKLSLQQ